MVYIVPVTKYMMNVKRHNSSRHDVTFPWVSRIEYFVFNASFIGRFYQSGNECNWTNTKKLVFSKPCQSQKLKSMFSKHFSSGWILLVPTLSLLKYFDITLPRHKSSKIEGTGPPLMSHSIQFHCFCFHFSTVSKRETVYTRWHIKGVPVSSQLQSFAGV